ncbi:multi-sensor signal transduction histidine kinase [Geobacter metallireducens RCH3]|uniref:histidine kinase n=1 Tax=Geobacter metallireducens (strain ATCC 53774 / DSM 7210 / GS-15) TaxID=269799 RepID=Q39U52_GEOMG|nr:XrtA/PEP-CTERM system histidine kinase PrsK [Geobacter metallireducens]ABB32222.1 sensor histidine kinase, GAF domain-containing [Geobacter metallireducens GS-15]EHP87010.1 multi-sensor signal transduction histidine kinase [Geobacter metallireducens RCH3]
MIQIVLSSIALLLAAVYVSCTLWRSGRTIAAYLSVVAIAVSASVEFCDLAAVAGYFGDPLDWKRYSLIAEGVVPAAWLAFSLTHARTVAVRFVTIVQRIFLTASLIFPAAVLALPRSMFFYSPDFDSERILFLSNAGYVFYCGLLVYVVISLINLEATFSNASLSSRWKIKFDFIGAGSFLAVLIFYYSQGLLYRTINMNLMPLRSLVFILALGMMLYSLLVRGNGVRIAVSRSMAYKSVVLFAVGLYLVALGIMGEGLRYFGEGHQKTLALGGAFIVGICLLVVLLSESAKRKVKVFIHKNFYQSKYDYRTQWLQFTDRLASARQGEELMAAILSGYCAIFAMGCGGLFVRNADSNEFNWAAGHELPSTGAVLRPDDPVLTPMIERSWVINLREDSPVCLPEQETYFAANGIQFLVPLFGPDRLEAVLVLGRPVNKNEQYLYEDYDLMKTLARQAASALMNYRLSEQLARSRELEVMGRVSAFIIHDLKNLVYTLSLTVDNGREHIADPEFQDDLLDTLSNTVNRMKVLISRLKNLPEKRSLELELVDLHRLAVDTAAMVPGNGGISVTGSDTSAEVDREEIQKVVMNLLVNALEATDGKGPVMVEVGAGSAPFIRVSDSGCGIPEEFLRTQLFSPFKTTKKKGLGIGLYQCRQIVEAHGGRIDVASTVGVGTVFTVWFNCGDQGRIGITEPEFI